MDYLDRADRRGNGFFASAILNDCGPPCFLLRSEQSSMLLDKPNQLWLK